MEHQGFRHLEGEERYGEGAASGDLAESKVLAYFDSIDRPLQEFGPKHIPTDRAVNLTWTDKIRHMPDFLGWGKFIEAQGCWSNSVVFKPDKLIALLEWESEMPVWFAVYIQRTDEILIAPLHTVLWSCVDERSQCILLDEGTHAQKYAYEVPIEVLLDVRVHDAFAVDKMLREKTRRRSQT
jgi:hypothetical protein